MLNLPVYPLHPSASLGGYEWRVFELEQELAAAASHVEKSRILAVLAQVRDNFQRLNPGKALVPCRSPWDARPVATGPLSVHGPVRPARRVSYRDA